MTLPKGGGGESFPAESEIRKEQSVQDYFPIHPGHILGLYTTPNPLDHQADAILGPSSVVRGWYNRQEMRAHSYPGRSPILRSASQRTAARGGKGRQGMEK